MVAAARKGRKTARRNRRRRATPPPPSENLVHLDSDERTADGNNAVDADGGPGSDDGLPASGDELTASEFADVTRMLLSNIAGIVGGSALNFDREAEDDIEFVDSEEESEEEEDRESENSEAMMEYRRWGTRKRRRMPMRRGG